MRSIYFLPVIFICTLCTSCSTGNFDNEYDEAFRERSLTLISHVADHYEPPSINIGDPEKFYWPKTMARFEKYGTSDSLANYWVSLFSGRSPFHFTNAGMARLLHRYAQAPSLRENELLILEKVFQRKDAYNVWTSEGTENHLAMDRTSGYLFAQRALQYPDHFPDAPEKLNLMKDWIQHWSGKVYHYGTGEWNSSTYQAYHIIGWLNLWDFAADPEVKSIARAVLDYYAAEMALHYSWGTYGGSEKRGRGAVDASFSASNYLCWLWFGSHFHGESFVPSGAEYIQSVHAITSSYRPPVEVVALARKEHQESHYYQNSKPSYLFEEPSMVKQFFFHTGNFTLGTSVSPYGGWTGTTSQIVNWKLVARRDDSPHPYEVSGNGRFRNNWSGTAADPFTQLAQHKNILVQLTLVPGNGQEITEEIRTITIDWAEKWQRDFSRRFPEDKRPNVVNFAPVHPLENISYITLPGDADIHFSGNTCYADLGTTYLAIQFVSKPQPDSISAISMVRGRKILTDQAPIGDICGFVMEAGDQSAYADLNDFMKAHKENTSLAISEKGVKYISMSGDTLEMNYQSSGRFTEALYDWGFGPEEPQTLITSPPFLQPQWPEGEGYGRLPQMRINGNAIDWTAPWPVYDGPSFKVANGILEVAGPRSVYRVDFTSQIPVFSTGKKQAKP